MKVECLLKLKGEVLSSSVETSPQDPSTCFCYSNFTFTEPWVMSMNKSSSMKMFIQAVRTANETSSIEFQS